jgi:hypothetical protein
LEQTRHLGCGDRTDNFHPAAHELTDRVGSLPLACTFTRRRNQKRLNLGVGIHGSQDWESLCRYPEMAPQGLRPIGLGKAWEFHKPPGPLIVHQLSQPLRRIDTDGPDFVVSQSSHQKQSFMELVSAGRLWPGFSTDFLDGVCIQNSEAAIGRSFPYSPGIYRLSTPFFERRIVEKCVRLGIQDLMR